jgi:hypothetical protein
MIFGAIAHAAQISMQVLRKTFPGRLISRFADIIYYLPLLAVLRRARKAAKSDY